MDLSILFKKPVFDTSAVLTIDVISPLSMVAKAPGKFYRSQDAPTDIMLLGLIENALGWHFDSKDRNEIIKKIKGEYEASEVGFKSLLQKHIKIEMRFTPAVTYHRDLWSQHLKVKGASFLGGSREYDSRAIPIMNAIASKKVTASDKARAKKDPNAIFDYLDGDEIHLNVIKPYFPQYYISPTPREYVEPKGTYRFRICTSKELSILIGAAFADPAAPLYVGSNDGWVEANWEEIS
jgi:CRISPR-associated protein Cas5